MSANIDKMFQSEMDMESYERCVSEYNNEVDENELELKSDEECIVQNNNMNIPILKKQYYYEILSMDPLSKDELLNCFSEYYNGSKEAYDKIILSNLRLVYKIASSFYAYTMNFDDLFQEGTIGLDNAVRNFNINLGYNFSVYAYICITKRISKSIYNNDKIIRLPVYLQEQIGKFRKEYEYLSKLNGQVPSVEELSDFTGLPKDKVIYYLNIGNCILSLENTLSSDDGYGNRIFDICSTIGAEDELYEKIEKDDLLEQFKDDIFKILVGNNAEKYCREELYNIYNFFVEYYKKKNELINTVYNTKLNYLRSSDIYSFIVENYNSKDEINDIERNIINKTYSTDVDLNGIYNVFDRIDSIFLLDLSDIFIDDELNELYNKANFKEEKNIEEFEKKYYDVYICMRQYDIICLRYGIGVDEPLSLKNISDKYGITGERVRQIEETSFCKLNKKFHTKKYSKDYIDI